ncbi:MAG: acyl-[acyl-carrier-protein] thioesterase [Eubacterium sp.]|nr:acyl-[acyl-carrier-protein] thioesterase [Eubacterium sp.]
MKKQTNHAGAGSGIYTMQTTVRYSECDSKRQVGLSGILDYLQDVCTYQAQELEIGLDYMQKNRTAWVLNSWQADIVRYPAFGETIQVTTWPYDFYGFLGFRNFQIEDEAKRQIVRANSVWVFMDMEKQRPARIAPEVAAAYQTSPRLEMEYMERKIPDFAAEPAGEPIQIPRYFIDTNQHVNNAKYILLAQELLPPDFHVVRIRTEYKKPAVYGEAFYPYLAQRKGCWAVKLCSREGKPYAVMEFYEKVF